MEHLNAVLTETSKKNFTDLCSEEFDTEDISVNFFNVYNNYKKIFTETKTNIIIKSRILNLDILKNFYHEFVTNENTIYIDNINKINLENTYNVVIENNNYFEFYLFNSDINYFSKLLHVINVFTIFVTQHVNFKIDKPVKIYIYINEEKRQLISSRHIDENYEYYLQNNTAFTTSGATNGLNNTQSFVYATKEEEIIKLLFHELAHLFKLDKNNFTNIMSDVVNKMPFKKIGYENEVVAELLSNIYNIINICIYVSIDNKLSERQEIRLLNCLLNFEKEYSIYVTAKILKYFNVPINELFDAKHKINIEAGINFYYVIKSIMYENLNLFQNYFQNNIIKLDESVYPELVEIIKNIKNSKYINKLNYYYQNINTNDNYSVSYILFDINLNKIDFANISIIEPDYKQKYEKYKNKYETLKNNK